MIKFTVLTSHLHGLFKVLSFSVSLDETRYYLNGICFEKEGDEVNFVATNGHTLTHINAFKNDYCQVTEKEAGEDNFSYIIPKFAIDEFLKTAKTTGKYTEVKIKDNKISFSFDGDSCVKTYKLIDGTFPAWRKVIPQKAKSVAGFNAKYLAQLCKVMESESLALSAVIEKPKRGTKDKPLKTVPESFSGQPFMAHNGKGANFVIMPMRV